MLLDMWSERHIQLLKQRFNEGISNKKSNCLDYSGFLKVFDHTKREDFERGNSILSQFGATICKQAFRLFDSSKFGAITFKDFCCALSIICLGSSNEKIRFLFDLYDLDRDGVLSKKELTLMLPQLIAIMLESDDKKTQKVRQAWVELQTAEFADMSGTEPVDYFQFHEWAENNVDVFKVLQPFELVPTPFREHEIVQQILDSNQRKHGDTFYVLSYRWWDSWKEFTEKHSTTTEIQRYLNKVRTKVAEHASMSDELKSAILGLSDMDEQMGTNLKATLEKAEWGGQDPVPDLGIEDMALSFSMRQQIKISKRRQSAIPSNRLLTETPRQAFSLKMSNASLNQHDFSKIEDSGSCMEQKFEYGAQGHSRQKDLAQNRTAGMGFQIQKERQNHARINPKSLTGPNSNNITRTYTLQSPQLVEEKQISELGSSHEDIELEKDLNVQLQETENLIKRDSQRRMTNMGGKLKKIVTTQHNMLNREFSSKSIKMDGSSLAALQESQLMPPLAHYGSRPTPIDNNDIEGEHPGQMQPNLIMFRDFVTIPEQAWKLFVTWYGLQDKTPSLPRKVLMHNSVASLELYPPRISCLISDREGRPVSDSQKSLFVSASLKIEEVHLKICELFNYISTRDTRLWIKQENEWTLVEAETYTVADGDMFMVEVKFYGNQWPKDSAEQQKAREWRQFEIGDKVDVKAGDTWKVGQVAKVMKEQIKVHFINENWKNDLVLKKDSDQVAQFGTHTLTLHFNKDSSVEQNLPSNSVQGIKNIGNTCYMNAVLQALLHTPMYRNYFKSQAFKKFLVANKEEDFLCEAFSSLVAQIKDSAGAIQVLEPQDFKKTVNTALPLFFGNQQQDAAEFFNFMLDKMNEEMNRVNKKHQTIEPENHPPSEQGCEKEDSDSQKDKKADEAQVKQQAIADAKQTLYTEFFQKQLPSGPNISQRKQSISLGGQVLKENEKTQDADSLNPNISATEAKAKNAWFTSLKEVNSPVSDLFVGQQTTEVTCLRCQNKTHTFENFYSLPVPLPVSKKSTIYVNLVRQQRKSQVIQPVIAYGLQLNRYAKLTDLIAELSKQTNLSESFTFCEISQHKVYRVHDDLDKQVLAQILKRTNVVHIFEHQLQFSSQRQHSANQIVNKVKAMQSAYTSFDEIRPGMLIDACDQYNKWYVGLVVEKQQTMALPSPDSESVQLVNKVLVHFYQLHQKFDEWYEESPESLKRLKPLGASQFAEQPKDQLIRVILLHRKSHQLNYVGLPYCLNIPNWLTWHQFQREICLQMMKHIRKQKPEPEQSTDEKHTIPAENDIPLALNSSNQVRRPGRILMQHQSQSPNILNFKNENKRLLEPIGKKIGAPQGASPNPLQRNSQSIQSLLAPVPEDCEHFKIKILESESQKCVFCLLAQKFNPEAEMCKDGCPVPDSDEQIKYTLNMFRQIEIVVDWDTSCFDPPTHFDSSYLRCKKQESEVLSGVPLGSCLELYAKKEKIEGYQCDTCRSQQTALIKPFISHLPDILVVQLKRFQFEAGYLDKLEDLVTFPLRNLDMQRFLLHGLQTNSTYDLFAVVNHHIYHTGGHYTAAIQLESTVWALSNDSAVTQVRNPGADLVHKDAYMLFYKRKEFTPSNILKLATHQV